MAAGRQPRLAERAKAARVEIKLDVFPEMQHVLHFAAGHAPDAAEAIDKLADWVRPMLGLS